MPFTLHHPSHPAHYRAVARLHAKGITEGFLSTLGPGFLARLYTGIDRAPGSGIILAMQDEKILGFVSYSRDTKGCYRAVLRLQGMRLALAILPMLFQLSIYRKLGETLVYPFRKRPEDAGKTGTETVGIRPELLSMAVDAETRGKGVGKALIGGLDREMNHLSVPGYYVVTHGTDKRSNGFYQRCGFIRTRDFLSHGKPMVEYYRTLAADRDPERAGI